MPYPLPILLRDVEPHGSSLPAPPVFADHLALDLLNTEPVLDGQLTDLLRDDAGVVSWLQRTGVLSGDVTLPRMRRGELTRLATTLRAHVRTLVERRRDEEALDLEPLNEMLGEGRERVSITHDADGSLTLARTFGLATALDLLLPVALAAAELLVDGDFDLVRQCDGGCSLYFYDRTKSHRRRWCHPDTCGNRDKVTRFRERASARTRR